MALGLVYKDVSTSRFVLPPLAGGVAEALIWPSRRTNSLGCTSPKTLLL
jgi:hypothetical protein